MALIIHFRTTEKLNVINHQFKRTTNFNSTRRLPQKQIWVTTQSKYIISFKTLLAIHLFLQLIMIKL